MQELLMTVDKILFIVEGEVAEPKVLNKLLSKMGYDGNTQIYSYKSNIYSLFNKLKKEYTDLEDVDLFSFIVELEKEKDRSDEIVNINRREISSIYLLFDLDAHHQETDVSQSFDNVSELITVFNNETTIGKLFISYPMVEALTMYHQIVNSKLSLYTFKADKNKSKSNEGFKSICNTNPRSHTFGKEYTDEDFEWIKTYHLLLCRHLHSQKEINFESYREGISTMSTFEKQLECHTKGNFIYLYSGIADLILDFINEDNFPDITKLCEYEIELINLWQN